MAIEIAQAVVALTPQFKGVQQSIAKELAAAAVPGGAAGKSIGGSFAGGFKTAVLPLAGIAAAGLGIAAVTGYFKDSFAAIANWEVLNAQSAAAVKATGGAAGVTAKQVNALAQSLEGQTATQAETIQQGANLLLTFRNVKNEAGAGNDVFNQTTKAAVDMSRALGTDVTSSAMMLGKALNDPTAGLAKLTKSGVTFTQQQKDQVAALQKSGDVLGAQKVILAEVNSEFGGSGAAYAKTYTGQLYLLGDAFGDIGESVVTGLLPGLTKAVGSVTAFIGSLDPSAIAAVGTQIGDALNVGLTAVINLATTVGPIFANVASSIGGILGPILMSKDGILALGIAFASLAGAAAVIGTVKGIIAGVALAQEAWTTATKIAAIAQTVFNAVLSANPIGLIVVAIAAVVGALVLFFTQTELGRTIWAGFVGFLVTAWTGIVSAARTIWAGLTAVISAVWTAIVGFVTGYVNTVRNVITTVFRAIQTVNASIWNGIRTVISAVWNAITGFVTSAALRLRSIVTTGLNAIRTVNQSIWNAIRTVVSTVWNAITSFIGSAISRVQSTISSGLNAARSIVVSVFNSVRSTVTSVWNTVVSTISGAVGRVVTVVTGLGPKVIGAITSIGSRLYSAGRSIIQNLINGITSMIGAVGSAIGGVVSKIAAFLPHSPALEGPMSGSGWTAVHGAGRAIATQVASGLDAGQSDVAASFSALTAPLSAGVTVSGGLSAELASVSAGGGDTINYYAAPNQSLDARQDLWDAIRRKPFLTAS